MLKGGPGSTASWCVRTEPFPRVVHAVLYTREALGLQLQHAGPDVPPALRLTDGERSQIAEAHVRLRESLESGADIEWLRWWRQVLNGREAHEGSYRWPEGVPPSLTSAYEVFQQGLTWSAQHVRRRREWLPEMSDTFRGVARDLIVQGWAPEQLRLDLSLLFVEGLWHTWVGSRFLVCSIGMAAAEERLPALVRLGFLGEGHNESDS